MVSNKMDFGINMAVFSHLAISCTPVTVCNKSLMIAGLKLGLVIEVNIVSELRLLLSTLLIPWKPGSHLCQLWLSSKIDVAKEETGIESSHGVS